VLPSSLVATAAGPACGVAVSAAVTSATGWACDAVVATIGIAVYDVPYICAIASFVGPETCMGDFAAC
jgi:hypothetical protein